MIGDTFLTFSKRQLPRMPSSEMPVRLRINGLDFLGSGIPAGDDVTENGNWVPLSPREFALEGLQCLRQARRTGQFVIELEGYPDVMLLKVFREDLVIASTSREVATRVPFETVYRLFEEFFDEVRDYFVRLFPETQNDRFWDLKDTAEISEGRYKHADWRSYFEEFGYLLTPFEDT